ncbi:hypothetical protein STAL104432_02075 [Streptomyces albus]
MQPGTGTDRSTPENPWRRASRVMECQGKSTRCLPCWACWHPGGRPWSPSDRGCRPRKRAAARKCSLFHGRKSERHIPLRGAPGVPGMENAWARIGQNRWARRSEPFDVKGVDLWRDGRSAGRGGPRECGERVRVTGRTGGPRTGAARRPPPRRDRRPRRAQPLPGQQAAGTGRGTRAGRPYGVRPLHPDSPGDGEREAGAAPAALRLAARNAPASGAGSRARSCPPAPGTAGPARRGAGHGVTGTVNGAPRPVGERRRVPGGGTRRAPDAVGRVRCRPRHCVRCAPGRARTAGVSLRKVRAAAPRRGTGPRSRRIPFRRTGRGVPAERR